MFSFLLKSEEKYELLSQRKNFIIVYISIVLIVLTQYKIYHFTAFYVRPASVSWAQLANR
jgi:hypothetical protein